MARELALVPATGPGADCLRRSTLRVLIDWLAPLPLGARRTIPGLDPGRVDWIVHGAVLLDAILAVTGVASARVCRRRCAKASSSSTSVASPRWAPGPAAAAG